MKRHELPTASNKSRKLVEVQRHIIEQQVQDSTQEEESPPCNSEDEEESLSFDEEDDETDYVLAEIGSRVEDDKPAESQNVSNGVMGEVMVIGLKTNSM